MAKMYYNVEEVTARLGCNEEQLRGLVRAGKLREFRDAGKLNYRVDEVHKLMAQTGDNATGGSGELILSSDSGDQPAVSKSGSSFGIEEADAPIDLGGSDSGMAALKSDSGSSAGLVLSDSSAPAAKAPAPKKGPDAKTGSGADILRLGLRQESSA